MAEAATDTADLQAINASSMQEPAVLTARKRALSDAQGDEARPAKMPTIYEGQDSQEEPPAANHDTNDASNQSLDLSAPPSDPAKVSSTNAPEVTRVEKQHEGSTVDALERPEQSLAVTRNILLATPSSTHETPAAGQPRASGTVSPIEVFGYAPPDVAQQMTEESSNVSHHPYFSPINTRNPGLGISGVPNLPSISASSSFSKYNYHARSRSYAGFYDGFTLPVTTASPAATPSYSLYTSYGVQQPTAGAPPTSNTENNLTDTPASQGRFPIPPNSHMDPRQIPANANQIFTPQSWLAQPASTSAGTPSGFSYIYGPNRGAPQQNVSPERSYRNSPAHSPVNNVNLARRNSIIQQQMGSPSSISSPSSVRQGSDAEMLTRINALYEQYQKFGQGAEQRNLEDHERNFYRTVSNRSLQEANSLASLMSLSKSVFGDNNEGIATSPTKQQQALQPISNELASPDRSRASSSSSYLRGTPISQYHPSPQLDLQISQNRQQQQNYTASQSRSIYQQQAQRFADFYSTMTLEQRETYAALSDVDKEKVRRAVLQSFTPREERTNAESQQRLADSTTPTTASSSSFIASSSSLQKTVGQPLFNQNQPPLLPLSAQAGLRASQNDNTLTESDLPTSSSALQITTEHNKAVQAKHERAHSKGDPTMAHKEDISKSQTKIFNGRSISVRDGGASTSFIPKVQPNPSDSKFKMEGEDKNAGHEGNSMNQEASVILHEHNDSGIAMDESPVKAETSTPGTRRSTRDRTKTFEGLAAIAGRFIHESPVKSGDADTLDEEEDSPVSKTETKDESTCPSSSAPEPFVFRGQRSKAFKKTVPNDFQGPQISRGDIVVDLDWDWNATVFQPLVIRFDDQTSPYLLSYNWSASECAANRRLVQYTSTFNANARELLLSGRVVQPEAYNHLNERHGPIISCIFRSGVEPAPAQGWTTEDPEVIYWVTGPDVLKITEAIISSTKFHCADLRGRIRSKTGGTNNRSYQVSRSGSKETERDFAKQIMDYDNPRPRAQDRPLRVTPWLELPQLLHKIAERFWVVV